MIGAMVRKTSSVLGAVGMLLLFVGMLVFVVDVIGRYFFNKPILGALEVAQVIIGAMVFLSWGSTHMAGRHVKLTMLYDLFPPRLKRICNFVTKLLTLVLFGLIAWQAALLAKMHHESGRLVYVIDWPMAPIQLVVSLGALVCCFVVIIELIGVFRTEGRD